MDSRTILDGCIEIRHKSRKKDYTEIYPSFVIKRNCSELMIKGGDFYAVWLENRGLWSTNEDDLIQLVDSETMRYMQEYRDQAPPQEHVVALLMRYAEDGIIDRWHKYCKQQSRDSLVTSLDDHLTFANDAPRKEDYASKRLPYPLASGPTPGWDALMPVLYSPEELRKLEWAIGAVVSGDSVRIQKFIALYGAPGTGKGTFLDIVRMLFQGYCCSFNAKDIGSANNAFALEAFRDNPLVGIQSDGNMSRIEDNSRLNALVSHEVMLVNEKFKSQYETKFRTFLFLATNNPVKITDARSGLIRRLIDVYPTGRKLKRAEYDAAMKKIPFELGAIAQHCLDVYKRDPGYYDNYIPRTMMGASNDFYNFVADKCYFLFKNNDGTTATAAWKLYNDYITEARVPYPFSYIKFKEELKNYFDDYKERGYTDDGTRVRGYYSGFRSDIFDAPDPEEPPVEEVPMPKSWIVLREGESAFDKLAKDWSAQYANAKGNPFKKWEGVKTTLKDLDTSKLHYVLFPEGHLSHIVIDFDIPDENGEKSLERNLEEASKWPETYCELSKSGKGVHLHYIYEGDPSRLERLFAPHIEIKVFSGNSSLRRMLSLCTANEIRRISSGLPLKGEKPPMTNIKLVRSERSLRRQIERNLNREIHPNTKPSIDMIEHILQDAYDSGMQYDVSDMRNAVFAFASGSTNQKDYCMSRVPKMMWRSQEPPAPEQDTHERPLVFFDCEVYPNLFVVCWKIAGPDHKVVPMINPSPQDMEDFIEQFDLVGFNNRKYDNHIIYARSIGVSIEGLYKLSKSIIENKEGFLPQAYDISYTDIYDFSSKKQSLKKFEIDLKIDHKELDIPWNEPVPENRWKEVIDYCCNDVLATEATFYSKKRQADFAGRKILAKLAGGTVNDSTNSLSTKFIFGKDRNPQTQFKYRFLGDVPDKVYRSTADAEKGVIFNNFGDENTLFDEQGRPVFLGYTYDKKSHLSVYRGLEVGEGGLVLAEPGVYFNVALLDVESMHPHSVIAENLFGDYYTKRFKEIVDARLAIKHGDIEKAKTLLNGELVPYLDDPEMLSGLKQALKIVINSVYGLTAAKFNNAFRDPRNIDNIVAKRGALFMANLANEVKKKGFIVAHIKTDSIKIPDATPEIIKFVQDYGEQYGYHFLHEATYERMCLVNDAVYIARYDTPEAAMKKYGYIPDDCKEHGGEWTATGKQFAVPYVFKTLFTKEKIEFDDLCETFATTSALYLDMNETLPDVSRYEKELDKLRKKPETTQEEIDILKAKIAEGHLYHFVGRVGRFCPVTKGGGDLLRGVDDKKTGERTYAFASGTKGYRWLETETVQMNDWQDRIDIRYYEELVAKAKEAIAAYVDPEWFCADDREEFPFIDIPPWEDASQYLPQTA